ncbi:MAG: CrcB family protein [Terrimesophilobacter sp.]
MLTSLLVAIGGGIGAALRLSINGAVHRRVRPTYPVAMSLINTSGAFLLGLISGLLASHVLPEEWGLGLGVGLVGGFTAFSTTSFHSLRLLQERRVWAAIANSLGMLAVAAILAGLGLWLGRAI